MIRDMQLRNLCMLVSETSTGPVSSHPLEAGFSSAAFDTASIGGSG